MLPKPGANGSRGALRIFGEIIPGGGQFTWAGAMFTPGSSHGAGQSFGKKEISFWAKGDGARYMLIVLTASRSGQKRISAMVAFVATKEWKQYTIPFSTFQADGGITELLFAAMLPPGKFEFQTDQVDR